ncbi:aqualysin-1-like [Diadema antillarum]|uniref:aqualysin-1-like n=1 Tax=Diadema antillarum TaxID=105358 RepID=UPI003A87F83E
MHSLILTLLLVVTVTNGLPADRLTAAIKDRYIVVFEDNVAVDDLVRSLELESLSIGGKFDVARRYYTALKGMAVTLDERSLKLVKRMSGVKYVDSDAIATIDDVSSWGLDRIDQRDLPYDNTFDIYGDGTGVTVYVLDTGIRDTHVEFGQDGRAVKAEADFVGDGRNGDDCHGHGTHCAGTAAGGIHGIARNANIVSVRLFDCEGRGSAADMVAAIDYTTSIATLPAVMSMSFGSFYRPAVDDAVAGAAAAGIVPVAAAGNSDRDACWYSPARAPAAITVGATDNTDTRAYFSNYGSCVDIFAPGVNIVSSIQTSDTATAAWSGTSMACPHVAGVAAVLLGNNPGMSPLQVRDAILSDATNNRLTDVESGSPNKLLYID